LPARVRERVLGSRFERERAVTMLLPEREQPQNEKHTRLPSWKQEPCQALRRTFSVALFAGSGLIFETRASADLTLHSFTPSYCGPYSTGQRKSPFGSQFNIRLRTTIPIDHAACPDPAGGVLSNLFLVCQPQRSSETQGKGHGELIRSGLVP